MEAAASLALRQLNPNPGSSRLFCGSEAPSPGKKALTPSPGRRSWGFGAGGAEPRAVGCSATRSVIFLATFWAPGPSGDARWEARGEGWLPWARSVLLVLPRAGGCVPLPVGSAGSLGWEPAFPAGETPLRSDKGMGVRVPPFVLGSWCTRLRRQKPLDARLSGGWSGINAPRGLRGPRPRRGPSLGREGGGGTQSASPLPRLPSGVVAGPLVRGVAGSGREFLQPPLRQVAEVGEPCLCRSWLGRRVGGRICPSREIGAPFGVIFCPRLLAACGARGWK